MLLSLRLPCLAICAFSLLAGPSTSLQAEDLRSPRFLEKARVGFDQIFDLDYDEAFTTFEILATEYPEHPGPPLYMATTIWLQELFQRQDLELDKFISPSYFDQASGQSMAIAEKTRFHELINSSQQLCEALLETSPGDKDARYFLGALHGILGSFAITIDHSRTRAFQHGKKAYRYHIALIEEDPDYYAAGQKLLKLGNVEAALEQFRKSLGDSETPKRERTLSLLASGNSLDLLDRRSEAVEYYQSVLKQPNRDRSHKQARKYLKKPFSRR